MIYFWIKIFLDLIFFLTTTTTITTTKTLMGFDTIEINLVEVVVVVIGAHYLCGRVAGWVGGFGGMEIKTKPSQT